jgi:hypothetical protein
VAGNASLIVTGISPPRLREARLASTAAGFLVKKSPEAGERKTGLRKGSSWPDKAQNNKPYTTLGRSLRVDGEEADFRPHPEHWFPTHRARSTGVEPDDFTTSLSSERPLHYAGDGLVPVASRGLSLFGRSRS